MLLFQNRPLHIRIHAFKVIKSSHERCHDEDVNIHTTIISRPARMRKMAELPCNPFEVESSHNTCAKYSADSLTALNPTLFYDQLKIRVIDTMRPTMVRFLHMLYLKIEKSPYNQFI